MKRLLTTGTLALTLCGLFTSCSHDENFTTLVESKVETYQKVFTQEFGEISPSQDWGFGQSSIVARARSYKTRAENANGNEWADITNSTGYGGWLVPDPLTDGQKLRVKAYFQANPNLTNEDPHWRNFFVQQVYKGATDPGPNSTEIVYGANGTAYKSDNMNLMTVGRNNVHINNFNNGDCSVYGNVLDNGSNLATHNPESYHSDKIMLMVNIDDTSCFGYHETGGSKHHNDKWALVSAEVIDAWAAQNGNIGSAVVDKWNRSFIGYDLELLNFNDVLETQTATYSDGPESFSYAMINGTIQAVNSSDNILYNNQPIHFVSSNTNQYSGDMIKLSDGDFMAEYRVNGQYMGKYLNIDKFKELLDAGYLPVRTKLFREWVKVKGSDGYFSDWIVTISKANRVSQDNGNDPDIPIFSGDQTKNVTYTTTYWYKLNLHDKGRIMCEDLGQIRASDIDFNDVVFDAYIYDAVPYKKTVTTDESGNVVEADKWERDTEGQTFRQAEIYLLAAGGTLQISVAGHLVKPSFADYISDPIIVNTAIKNGDEVGGSYSNPWENITKAPKIEFKDNDGTMELKDIKILVKYGQEILELNAEPGLAPHKICVPLDLENGVDVRWAMERVVIKDAYTDFGKYVKNEDKTVTYNKDGSELTETTDDGNTSYYNSERNKACWTDPSKIVTSNLFTQTVDYTPRNLTTDGYIENTGKSADVSTGTITIPGNGYNNGDPVLVRRRN